jgi:hypothetical protein
MGNATAEPGGRSANSTTVNSGEPFNVIPLPDPEAPYVAPLRREPPQLLNPRDRTARAEVWGVVPISWPAPTNSALARPAEPSTRPRVDFDDSGWQSTPR